MWLHARFWVGDTFYEVISHDDDSGKGVVNSFFVVLGTV
jgi:hypothetical protein